MSPAFPDEPQTGPIPADADCLVMGFATGYPAAAIAPYLFSLRSHYSGPVVLFVEPDAAILPIAAALDVRTVAVPPSGALHPTQYRFQVYRDWLAAHPAPRGLILISDVRDVYFQGPPFRAGFPGRITYFVESTAANPTTLAEFNNQTWLRSCFGADIVDPLLPRRILCSGTIAGTAAGIADYLDRFTELLAEIPADAAAGMGRDQAIHNRIAYEARVPGAAFLENIDRVATLCGVTAAEVDWDPVAEQVICDGERPPIVHQYDRYPPAADPIQALAAGRLHRLTPVLAAGAGRTPFGAALHHIPAADQPAYDQPPVIFTIASVNYLGYAAVLMESVRRHMPRAIRLIYLIDAPTAEAPPLDAELAVLLPFEAIDFPDARRAGFAYSAFELANAAKPFCFRHALAAHPGRPVLYLDSDTRLYAPLDPVLDAFAAGAELVMTPHLDAPLDDGRLPNDLAMLRGGVNNMGFLGLLPSAATRRLLDWWGARLARDCRVALGEGIFVDQSWMALAPSFVARTHLLRHPGCNLAYWNLSQRPLSRDGDDWRAAGRPLVFFHFSGLRLDPLILSAYENRHADPAADPLAYDLARDYAAALAQWDHAARSRLPYGRDRYADGRPIPACHRHYYRDRLRDDPAIPADPFTLDPAFWARPEPGLPQDAAWRVTRHMVALHRDRGDIHRNFALTTAEGRRRYADWCATDGQADAGPPIANGEGAIPAGPAAAPGGGDRTARRVAELEAELAGLRGSTSWRVTQPLRYLVNRIRGAQAG